MAQRKRAVVDLTVDSPRRPPPARRGHVGLSAAAPIDLDSDQEDSGAASPFRPPPTTTAQAAPASSSGASASASASVPASAGSSSSSSSASTATGSGRPGLPPTGDWLRPAAEVTCPICMCETPPAEAAVLTGCAHAFCEDCIGQYVRGKVDEGKVMAERHVERAPRRGRPAPGAPSVVGGQPSPGPTRALPWPATLRRATPRPSSSAARASSPSATRPSCRRTSRAA
jgi:hypothetical protein